MLTNLLRTYLALVLAIIYSFNPAHSGEKATARTVEPIRQGNLYSFNPAHPGGTALAAEPARQDKLLEPICQDTEEPRTRRRPGEPPRLPYVNPACDSGSLPSPAAKQLNDLTPVPNRWRIVEALGYPDNRLDPYNGNNPLKGDRPIFGQDWFFSLTANSSSQLEPRRLPIVGQRDNASSGGSGSIATGDQLFFVQDFSFDMVLYQGDTVFRPPDYQLRFTPVLDYNQTWGDGKPSNNVSFAVQSLFFEKYLRTVSDHYDFDGVRIGVQPFTSDFRGFLFLDQPLGVRLFGTRRNNIFQYNLAWFRRLRKHTNTRLNDVGESLPDNDIFFANLYWQDLLQPGFNSQFSVAYNRNRESGTRIIADEFGASPIGFEDDASHDFDVVYLGYNGDGHLGRVNLSGSLYYALGQESSGTFNDSGTDVRAFFAAAEASMDFDWIRVRLAGAHASGDDDPFDERASGFDGISENPIFAGSDSSFYIHQALPLAEGRFNLTRRNALFNGLRSAIDSGQSNFTNPGLSLLGVGADFDLTPGLRISFNANQLWFDKTQVLKTLLSQRKVGNNIGQDLSVAAFYRPFATQNMIFRLSAAALLPGRGYQDIYDSRAAFSVLGNLILTY